MCRETGGVAEIELYGSATVWKGLKSAENMRFSF